MKFRDEDNLKAIVIESTHIIEFQDKLNELDRYYDLIDLQYSTTTLLSGDVEYSALALVRRK